MLLRQGECASRISGGTNDVMTGSLQCVGQAKGNERLILDYIEAVFTRHELDDLEAYWRDDLSAGSGEAAGMAPSAVTGG